MNQTKLVDFLDSLERNGIPGCECVVYHNREPVFRHAAGFSDAERKKKMAFANTFWLYSTTKLVTCTSVMQLVEKGRIGLDDPVSNYLPEYGDLKVRNGSVVGPAKNAMTIRHLLSMQSGLNYNLEAPSILGILDETGRKATTRQIIRALAEEPLDFEPGTRYQYSLSHDVLGAVIEAVSGQRLGAYFDEHVFKPLGMKNTGFELTPERRENMAGQFQYDMGAMTSAPASLNNVFVISENYESGGAGLISTIDDYIIFLDAMCNGGTGKDGYKLLSMETIDMMRSDQLSAISKKDFGSLWKEGYSYGLGVRTLVEKRNPGPRSPLGEFGWDGAAGAYALIDVENRLAIWYLMHVCGCAYGYEAVHPKIRDLAYDMLGL